MRVEESKIESQSKEMCSGGQPEARDLKTEENEEKIS